VTSESPAIPPAGSGSAGVYLAVKGVRDIASGLFVFIFMASLATHVLGGLMLAATIIPATDRVIVLAHHGPEATAAAFTLPRLQHENELTGLGG
jgi:hypothetical protein